MMLLRVLCVSFLGGCALVACTCAAQITVPDAPPAAASPVEFHDSHEGVRFEVPAGWSLNRKDGQVSTFHNDARSASPKAKVRGVAIMDFNPFPYSTFSGALFYFSVTPHMKQDDCAAQAISPDVPASARAEATDVEDIGGMKFTHGHDEHGELCVEARDEVYTAFRKGSCYRFDLAINTFCGVSSGAQDITDEQVYSLNKQMANILSTVELHWTKTGAHPVPVPEIVQHPAPKTEPKQAVQAKNTLSASR